jgi:hypothetical protein
MTARALVLTLGLLAVSGCGASARGPTTYPVTGEVKLNGAPVAGADVAFTVQDQGGGATPAQAVTDASGRFEVATMFDQGKITKPGMTAGEYAVTVTQLEQQTATSVPTQKPKNLLPEQYASTETSGLSATVTPEGAGHFVFDLAK